MLRKTLPALFIVLIAFIAYANAWPNSLVMDDKLFENPKRFAQLSDIPGYFMESAWATQGFQSSLYRPLLLTSITLDSRLYGDWVAGFHLTNIILHVLASLLVYIFLMQLLRGIDKQASPTPLWALLAAAIFAVHPVHTEAVASIFNRSDVMVALATGWGGIGIAVLSTVLVAGTAYGELLTKKSLSLEDAKKAAAGAAVEVKKNNWKMAIAVVDDGGHLIYFERIVGTQSGSIDVSIGKARTALAFKRPTKALEDAVNAGQNAILSFPNTLPREGGVPFSWTGRSSARSASAGGNPPRMRRSPRRGSTPWRSKPGREGDAEQRKARKPDKDFRHHRDPRRPVPLGFGQ